MFDRINDVQTNDEVQAILNAIERFKRRLCPRDRCRAEMHDHAIFERALTALRKRKKREQLQHVDRFASRVVNKDLTRTINRERSRCRNFDDACEEKKRSKASPYHASKEDPVAEASQSEQSEMLMNAIQQLPEKQKEVLRSLYLGCDYDQNLSCLGERLGVVRQTVATWRDLGLSTLQRLLQRNPNKC